MKKSLTVQLIQALITVIILYTITSIVPRLISTYFSTYFYLLILGLCLLLLLVSRGKSSINEYIMLVIPFFLRNIIMYFVSRQSLTDWVYSTILDFIPIVIGLYIIKRCDKKTVNYYAVLMILAFVITMITTYIGIQTYPNSARYLATVASPNDSLFIKYNMANIGGYDFIYSIVLLYPVVIYAHKRGVINLFVTLIISFSILTLIIESSYTTAFLMWLVSSVLLFLNKDFKAQFLIIIAIVAVLFLAVFSNLISEGLGYLSTRIDNKDISERLLDLAGGRKGLTESEDPRWELWSKSVNEFLAHPLLGNLDNVGGGHSFILDTFAKYGLLGGILITWLYIIIFRKFFMPFKNTGGYGFIVWAFLQTIILSVVNTGMWLNVLCLFVPTLLAFIKKGERKNESALGRELDPQRLKSESVRQAV